MRFLIVFAVCCLHHIVNGSPTRIAGGSETSVQNYPFSASLITNSGSGNFLQACGGTILTNSAILTAASCFFTNGVADPVGWWRVKVGSSGANFGGTIYLLRQITLHPDYSPSSQHNDIAVARTTFAMHLSLGSVEAASIAGAAYQLNNDQQVWAIGWGATTQNGAPSEQLRHVQFWTIDQQTCANRYNEVGVAIQSSQLCAGWLDVGVRGQCQGDTGSPLLHNGVVVGVFSFSQGCPESYRPNINTRLSSYTSWVVAAAIA